MPSGPVPTIRLATSDRTTNRDGQCLASPCLLRACASLPLSHPYRNALLACARWELLEGIYLSFNQRLLAAQLLQASIGSMAACGADDMEDADAFDTELFRVLEDDSQVRQLSNSRLHSGTLPCTFFSTRR